MKKKHISDNLKVTATLPGDKSGAVVEKIKSDFLPPWLR